jgi:hypothetical protein
VGGSLMEVLLFTMIPRSGQNKIIHLNAQIGQGRVKNTLKRVRLIRLVCLTMVWLNRPSGNMRRWTFNWNCLTILRLKKL